MNFTPHVGNYLPNTTATRRPICVTRRPGWWRPVAQSRTASSEQSDAPERRSQATWRWRLKRRRPVIGSVRCSAICARNDDSRWTELEGLHSRIQQCVSNCAVASGDLGGPYGVGTRFRPNTSRILGCGRLPVGSGLDHPVAPPSESDADRPGNCAVRHRSDLDHHCGTRAKCHSLTRDPALDRDKKRVFRWRERADAARQTRTGRP